MAELCFQRRTPCRQRTDPCTCALPPQHAVFHCSEALPQSQPVPSAVAAGSARSSSGTPRATGGGTPRASVPHLAAAAAAPSRPEPGASAREQWEFLAGTAESPGPWADILRTLNGGRGLTALTAPQSVRLPCRLSFVGLESIKQQADNVVKEGGVRVQ